MGRQRNMSKTKEQEKEKELNETEASKLPDIEFNKTVIRMLRELSENFNKEIASI